MLAWQDDFGRQTWRDIGSSNSWASCELRSIGDTFDIWRDLDNYDRNPIYLSGGEYPPNEQTKQALRKKNRTKSKAQRKARKANR